MAEIPLIKDKIKMPSKLDLMKMHLLIKLTSNKITVSDSELTLLASLYLQKGIRNKEEMSNFFEYCISNKIRLSAQSVRNILARFTQLNVIVKPKPNQRFISKEYMLDINEENNFAFNYTIYSI